MVQPLLLGLNFCQVIPAPQLTSAGLAFFSKQWGKVSFEKGKTSMSVSYPIAVSNSLTVWAFDYGPACESVAANLDSSTAFTMYRLSGGTSNYRYVALGIA